MAIHINPTNINPNVGNTFEAGYKARMAEKQPWIDARNKSLKDIAEAAKLGLAAYMMGNGGGVDVGDTVSYYGIDNGELDETDFDLFNSGIDPKLFNDMNRYNTATTNYRSMFDGNDIWGD